MALPVHLELNEVPDFNEQEAVARLYNQVETRFQIERKTVNVQQLLLPCKLESLLLSRRGVRGRNVDLDLSDMFPQKPLFQGTRELCDPPSWLGPNIQNEDKDAEQFSPNILDVHNLVSVLQVTCCSSISHRMYQTQSDVSDQQQWRLVEEGRSKRERRYICQHTMRLMSSI
ncbi:hypothetical protein An12g09400 [Aspergillus niger]|uniref:Uncharacterized protein n=2 Tax=Aspergillus niger TaxID=5061 RepID=A2R0Q3_ASPNC|nr:hypothetical protein An12g09400 [Aspergillus niger]CAK41370.1 hypothetical protein An12g09400 [Aspergillus niger]